MWLDYVYHGRGACGKQSEYEVGPNLTTSIGLSQGGSLSPLLLDLDVDVLAIIMENARQNEVVRGVLNEVLDHGVNMLQYADDTILLLQGDIENAKIK